MCFDDHFPCRKKENCDRQHMHVWNWLKLFALYLHTEMDKKFYYGSREEIEVKLTERRDGNVKLVIPSTIAFLIGCRDSLSVAVTIKYYV